MENINEQNEKISAHKIEICARNHTIISGITNVESATETGAVLYVDKMILTLEGESLKVQKIDVATGDVEILGTIKSLKYSDTKKKSGFLKKLVK